MLKSKEKKINSSHFTTHNSGITLIALVVTIIILLILAGVTLNLILAEGGLFNRAQETEKAQEMAVIKDYVGMAQAELIIENKSPSNKYDRSSSATDSLAIQIMKANFPTSEMTITDHTTNSMGIVEGKFSGKLNVEVKSTGNKYEVTINNNEVTVVSTGEGSSTGGSGETGDGGTTVVPVTKIELDKTSENILQGGSLILTATITPSDATNKNVTWTSSNTNAATVSGNGLTATVTTSATATGKTTITVKTEDGNFEATCDVTVEKPTVASLIGQEPSDTNVYAVDKYGNPIVIPSGFTVVPNGEDGVVYDYALTDGTSPVVQDGIVIEDGEGNQFVWVPVGDINNKEDDEKGATTNIKLGRYENFTMGENNTPPDPKQLAENWDENDSKALISGCQEYAESSRTNTKAYNLEEWITSSLANKGYYVARYEASKNGDKAASKVSTGSPATSNSATISNGMLWTNILQPNAATAARNMYPASTGANYYSDLINSYAWDTAIIFIQTYSGNTTYASQTSKNTGSPANTGTIADKVCNIYDMASNVQEWTTETASSYVNPNVRRGGFFSGVGACVSTRTRLRL